MQKKLCKEVVVSAVSTTLNCRDGLEDCLTYFYECLCQGMIKEIVIVDGGSTDGTWQIIDKYTKMDDRVKVITKSGANISQGRNIGASMTKGNIILFFDSGCIYGRGYITEMLGPFLGENDIDVVGGKTIAYGSTPFSEANAMLLKNTPKDYRNPSSRSLAIKKSIFEKIKGYNESVKAGEDTHFNRKWKAINANYVHKENALVYWHVRKNLFDNYRMMARNTEGTAILGNPIGVSGILHIITALIFIVNTISILSAYFLSGALILWLTTLCMLLIVALTRTVRHSRWKYFIIPKNFIYGNVAVVSLAIGFTVGYIKGKVKEFI